MMMVDNNSNNNHNTNNLKYNNTKGRVGSHDLVLEQTFESKYEAPAISVPNPIASK
jgi:hypothetical protein